MQAGLEMKEVAAHATTQSASRKNSEELDDMHLNVSGMERSRAQSRSGSPHR